MSVNTQLAVEERPSRRLPWIQILIPAAIALIILVVFTYRLNVYPAPWYDEGSHLHVAKNFALNGVYADYSSEGNRYFGPAVGVGPTVLLPIAALYNLFGVSIPLARLLIVIYGCLSLIAFYVLGARLFGSRQALLGLALVLLSPGVDFVYTARTVLGEVPGLFFLLAALWLWLTPSKPGVPRLFAVGLFMGLACITKNQYALFILPALLLCLLADRVWYRQRGWLYFIVPGIVAGLMFAIWTYIVLIALGETSQLAENLATLRSASAGAFFLFKSSTIERAVRFLLESTVYGGLFIPVLVYALAKSRRRSEQGQQFGILFIFIVTGMGLFLSSIGWPRYAFTPLVLLGFFVSNLLSDLTDNLRPDWEGLRAMLRGDQPTRSALVTLLVGGLLVVTLAAPLATTMKTVLTDGSDDAYRVAQYLQSAVPQEVVIETWEQELAILTDHTYHYPPQWVLANAVAEVWLSGPAANDNYDFRDYAEAEYVIVGPFSKYTSIYPMEYLEGFTLVETIGAYDIYSR